MEDTPLLFGIISDLFPTVESVVIDNSVLKTAIENEMKARGHQVVGKLVEKAIQLYETKLIRHGVMIIGDTCSGKSSIWSSLQSALNALSKTTSFAPVKTQVINPKAFSL